MPATPAPCRAAATLRGSAEAGPARLAGPAAGKALAIVETDPVTADP